MWIVRTAQNWVTYTPSGRWRYNATADEIAYSAPESPSMEERIPVRALVALLARREVAPLHIRAVAEALRGEQ